MKSLTELVQVSYSIALEKGWWETPRSDSTCFDLMQSEVAEALEDYRNHHLPTEHWLEKEVKPCGIPTELADFCIRIGDFCGDRKIDLQKEFDKPVAGGQVAPLARLSPNNDFEKGLAMINFAISMAWANCDDCEEIIPKSGPFALGVGFWLARAVDYTFDLCVAFEIDIWYFINLKTEFNRTRERRHGGKKV
jgi:hypothetical protein